MRVVIVLISNHWLSIDFSNFPLNNCLAQVLEIWYVEMPGGPLPRLFKCKSLDPTWPCTRRILCSNHRNP